MYCKLCRCKAIIRLPYAKLSLCRKHFNEFIERKVLKSINRYHMVNSGRRVLVAVSGGKDSSTLLHILSSLRSTLKLELYGVYIDLGLGEYSKYSRECVEKLFKTVNVEYTIIELEKGLGYSVPKLSSLSKRPKCSICGLIKRYTLNAIALHNRIDIVATGHTLDDVIAYIVKEFITGNYSQLYKLKPKLDAIPGLMPSRIKPLIEVSERECLTYAISNKLPVHYGECPYSPEVSLEMEIKQFFNRLEVKHPGIKIQFLRKFVKEYSKSLEGSEGNIRKCSVCGLPSSSDICALCKLVGRVDGSYSRVLDFHKYIEGLEFKHP
ncbi:MAG TPA: TIGR00269 family protein [Desulfurococcales archaeon]|nr:TIGR00269 family protein [Desulfurococcales archaeon]